MNINIDNLIKEKVEGLEVVIEDVQSMSHEDYALARKNGFGASDSSVLLGVNLYKKMDELIAEKNKKFITEEEKAVGEKAIVRKGYDLEPLILDKAEQLLETRIYKPQNMYGFKKLKGMNINFDGVFIDDSNRLIPVEAKLVSKYGEKYYIPSERVKNTVKFINMKIESGSLQDHIKAKAQAFGIPAYYYTQVQEEIAALDAPYGYLVAQFDESWQTNLYYIKRDDYVIAKLFEIAETKIREIK